MLNTTESSHCMNCKKSWDRRFLVNNFTQKFINKDYKTHREQCLLEMETALLPATQPLVEQYKIRRAANIEISQIKRQIHELYKRLAELKYQSEHAAESTPQTFVRKCPNETCRGFLSTQWKCGLCEMWSCPDCYELKGQARDSPHVCKTENVETAKLLAKDTKPCPKCGVLICKLEGCRQIWCTQCHTAFDWKTGRLEQTIHNPHYYEWLRRNTGGGGAGAGGGFVERNIGDIQCGREIDNHFSHRLLSAKACDKTFWLAGSITDFRLVVLPRFRTDRLRDNEHLRIQYLLNDITKEKFKTLLQKKDKETTKRNELTNVLAMFISCSTDIMYRYIAEWDEIRIKRKNDDTYLRSKNKSDTGEVFEKYDVELENLRTYTNECLQSISVVYKSRQYIINRNKNFLTFI